MVEKAKFEDLEFRCWWPDSADFFPKLAVSQKST
jgi:hypothetical protein